MIIGNFEFQDLRRINPAFAWVVRRRHRQARVRAPSHTLAHTHTRAHTHTHVHTHTQFFIAYVLLFFLILTNIFLAIVLDAWHYAKAEQRATDPGVDVVEEVKRKIRAKAREARKKGRSSQFWRKQAQLAWRWATNAGDERRTFMPPDVVMSRLQQWRRDVLHRDMAYISFADLAGALRARGSQKAAPELQIVRLFRGVPRTQLVTREQAAKLNRQRGGGDTRLREMNVADVRKLRLAMADVRLGFEADAAQLVEQLGLLRRMQRHSHAKIKFLQTTLKELVPMFAEAQE